MELIPLMRGWLKCGALLALGWSLSAAPAAAEQGLKDKDPAYVLSHWGAPIEKIELESRHEELWLYEHAQVLFREGHVVEAHSISEDGQPKPLEMTAPIQKKKPELAAPPRGAAVGPAVPVEDILSEIMHSSGQGEKGVAVPVGPNMPPAMPNR